MRSAALNTNFSYRNYALIVFMAALFSILTLRSNAQTAREYNIKAAFLYNFTQFVDWPATAFSNAEAPFVIGILGSDPFGSSIDEAVATEKVKGHPIKVQRYQIIKDIKSCHILYICNSEVGKLKEILPALHDKNVLTVSDIPEFATTGGIIRFMTKENKIKLQINLSASKDADLNISSRLLQVAEIVR